MYEKISWEDFKKLSIFVQNQLILYKAFKEKVVNIKYRMNLLASLNNVDEVNKEMKELAELFTAQEELKKSADNAKKVLSTLGDTKFVIGDVGKPIGGSLNEAVDFVKGLYEK